MAVVHVLEDRGGKTLFTSFTKKALPFIVLHMHAVIGLYFS